MARSSADIALFMQAIAEPESRSPHSLRLGRNDFCAPLERDFDHCRVSLLADYGGLLPVESPIVECVAASSKVFEAIGATVEYELPDFGDADHTFKTLRAQLYAAMLGATLDQHRDQYKATLIWNIECGLALDAAAIRAAESELLRIRQNLDSFFERFDYLVLPVTQVMPFPAELEYPSSINGETQHTYLDWMRSCYYLSVPGHPAVSVPAGFDANGLPIGVQIVGRYGDDFGVLQMAHAFEQATQHGRVRPAIGNN